MHRVTYYRQKKNMSQADLCRAASFNPQLLSLIEKGTRNLSIKSAKTLAPVLGVKWYELFNEQ